MGYHFLLQGIFLTQELNSHLLYWQAGFVVAFFFFFKPLAPPGKLLKVGGEPFCLSGPSLMSRVSAQCSPNQAWLLMPDRR